MKNLKLLLKLILMQMMLHGIKKWINHNVLNLIIKIVVVMIKLPNNSLIFLKALLFKGKNKIYPNLQSFYNQRFKVSINAEEN